MLLFHQFKFNLFVKSVLTMKRITKDRCAKPFQISTNNKTDVSCKPGNDLEESSQNTKQKTRSTKPTKINEQKSLPTRLLHHGETDKSLVLSKFKVRDKPKIKHKRLHLLLENETMQALEMEKMTIDVKLEPPEIKIEDSDLTNEDSKAVNVKSDFVDLPSPSKMLKLESSSKIKLEGKSPQNWEEMLENLRHMRKDYNAPVDTMGCDMCMDKTSNPKDARYQALLSLMLSSMTKDNVTFAAMQKLIAYGCTVDKMLEISDEKLGELIYPVNYWKKKVQYIKDSTKIIKEEYDGDIPRTVKDLCKLRGVGPKMAHLCMKTAWNEVTGIGVDTHVHRISNRMGWAQSKTPEGTRKQLEDWLPQHLWMEVNHLLVGFGQQVCQPSKPQCVTCLNNNICPFGIVQLNK